MHSIPAPVIKKLLDYCDLPSAIIMARVTKRCSTIFRQYREEILIRCEYINVPNMFYYCSDEFIITMFKHRFFDHEEARDCCLKKRYQLYEKLEYGKLFTHNIDDDLLCEIYKNGEFHNIYSLDDHKLDAAQLGIDLDVPYPDNEYGLYAALLLQNEEMINKLQDYGSFHVYCVTGYYHLADNYDVDFAVSCINDSNDPLSAFNYIEKRGYIFTDLEYFMIEHYEVLKLVMPKITQSHHIYQLNVDDYDSLMIVCNKLLEFTTIDNIFQMLIYQNVNFTKYLFQKYNHLINKFNLLAEHSVIINLLDFLDNKVVMQDACKTNRYTLIRALIRRNGREWARRYNHPFIEKYYS